MRDLHLYRTSVYPALIVGENESEQYEDRLGRLAR